MFAFSTDREPEKLKSAFKILFSPPIKDFKEIQIKDVKFSLKPIDGGVIFFTIADANL